MRKSAVPARCVQRERLIKHEKNAKKLRDKRNKIAVSKKYNDQSILNWLNLNEIKSRGQSKRKLSNYINLPRTFSIFENPEECLEIILRKFPKVFYNNRKISLRHEKVKNWSLGSEVLLGIVAKDIKSDRVLRNKEYFLDGDAGDDLEYKQVLASIGLIKDINAIKGYNIDGSPQIHVFEENGFHYENPSADANDKKKKAVLGFVKYLDECLEDHDLVLSEDAADNLKECLSEVLDNAIEHNGEKRPNWRIRGFLSNKHERRTLEITVLNFGRSIPKTITRLPKDNPSRIDALNYVNMHQGKMTQDQLLTVWALQGGQSCKNDHVEKTRGIGTVALIDAFEGIYEDYKDLKGPSDGSCKMNIITGNVVVHFDGKYKSKLLESEDGSERVIIPFNKEETLGAVPDKRYVRAMRVALPGVMINISLPLRGSVTPLDK